MNPRVQALCERLDDVGADAFICYSSPNYRYLSGFTGSLAILVVSRSQSVIMSDFRYRTQVAQEVSDFDFIEIKGRPEETVLKHLTDSGIKRLAFETAHLTYRNYAQLKSIESIEFVPTEDWVEELRAVKDDAEIKLIERAAAIIEEALAQVLPEIRPGMTETEVSNRIYALIRSLGGKKEAFDLIVASGPRSAMPHGAPTNRLIQPGEPIVIDIGAQFEGYHSDLTRTVWLDKMRTSQVLEIYEIVDKAQAAAMAVIEPGKSCVEIDAAARDMIVEAGYGDLFGHGLGHGVGLEVHESPTISRLGKGTAKPGMVFTVEPGIYIPDVGGVRIEDMIVVTDTGHRRLTKSEHSPGIGT